MGAVELIKSIVGADGEVNYEPWSMDDVKIFYGIPPIRVRGFEYVIARHNFPQWKLVMSLTGSGVFVPNNNKSGTIEIGILNGSASVAGVDIIQLTGIPFPL
ncbi:MAG: hypothetical protein GY869_11405, partial [Planctomycetes bacterium]|nr:hypothetical protein [Planctomycetota bacterium]